MSDTRPLEPDIAIASPDVGETELRRIHDVLRSGHLSGGDEVAAFGEEFADYCTVAHGVPTSNGTTALHAALEALELGADDTVLTTPFSFVATANAVRHVGATPVFADIDPTTYNLDPEAVEATAEAHGDIDAILAVHLYGCPAPMAELREIADRYDAALVEDAAQAHGAAYRGRPVGSLGDVACFSFYPTKNMTTGEGGMVVTDDDALADRLRSYIDHGRDGEGNHAVVGHNFRMTDICAAVGRVQLGKLDDYVAARREHAAAYDDALAETDVVGPVEPDGCRHAYHQYTVRCDDREALRSHLRDYGISPAVYYPTPIHEEPAYDNVDASLPAAERAAKEVLSLPVHPSLSTDDVRRITVALTEYEA
ncbi:DegT/DnrJ/EryC1/StrS family aminotransferase [Haloarcula nitratireducens]|uniref:DegT/DnrJ/EryC1/StrS family aminotransferase n=1 Tax=Haloarcula nitratireducens TaxID=2487749 RepID=A0AAW4P8T0_9EURY|nr:DegT/DnrJ/EryC1/StrS family aminotransferase [Halomicroarcula nitratireducens]MBX0294070.1 DegT/DnrJ/EryC1/StrS family aminotransferase [Halomicroarcula nitratireducens]